MRDGIRQFKMQQAQDGGRKKGGINQMYVYSNVRIVGVDLHPQVGDLLVYLQLDKVGEIGQKRKKNAKKKYWHRSPGRE